MNRLSQLTSIVIAASFTCLAGCGVHVHDDPYAVRGHRDDAVVVRDHPEVIREDHPVIVHDDHRDVHDPDVHVDVHP